MMLAAFGWSQERPRLLGISHIAVRVKNLDASRQFYTGLLGYQEAFTIRKVRP
jgi:catechol-2,3-dioxygenase